MRASDLAGGCELEKAPFCRAEQRGLILSSSLALPILLLFLLFLETRGSSAQSGIHVAGERHLYLDCEGQRHGPAVILDAGLYRDSSDWKLVQPKIAHFTQVCSYDREGLGKSVVDKGVNPETECIDEQVEDLRNLLRSGHVRPPYVLVGHSAGGLRVRRYTRDHPNEVSGLVFVDSANEEQSWRFQAIDPRSVQGPPANPDFVRCGGGLPAPGEHLVWHSDKPLIVLEHGIPLTFDGPTATHTAEFNAAVDSMARDLASRSSKAQFRVAAKSGHDIMLDEPTVVVQAVQDVWHQALSASR
jgi:pimeloyl-ACP methyl ester carboxylesterase